MLDVRHDEAAHQFTAQLEGLSAQLEYALSGNVMSITHTLVPGQFRGRGVAAALMQAALNAADSKGWEVNPVCSYAVAYMQRRAVEGVRHQDELLDEALEESFPASDSPAVGGVS